MKKHKSLILEGKLLSSSKHWKGCWSAVKPFADGCGLDPKNVATIEGIVAGVMGSVKDPELFKDAAKKVEANDEIDESSLTAFNRIYNKILLEADDDKKGGDVDSGTDASGEVYYLKVHGGKGAIVDKNGEVTKLTDDDLTEFVKKLKTDRDAFKPGKEIRIGSVADAKEDEADKNKAAFEVLKLFKKDACSQGEFPEFNYDGYEPDQEKIKAIVEKYAGKVTKKIQSNKRILDSIDIEKIEDKAAVSQFVYAAMCAGAYVRSIKILNTAAKKADDDKAAVAKKAEEWKQACIEFQKSLPARDLAACCDLPGMDDVKIPAGVQMLDYNGKLLEEFSLAGNEIDSDDEIEELRRFMNLDYENDRPGHPQCIQALIGVIMQGKSAGDVKWTDLLMGNTIGNINALVKTSDSARIEKNKNGRLLRDWFDKAQEVIDKYPDFTIDKLQAKKDKK